MKERRLRRENRPLIAGVHKTCYRGAEHRFSANVRVKMRRVVPLVTLLFLLALRLSVMAQEPTSPAARALQPASIQPA
jgi:hypothetical protein